MKTAAVEIHSNLIMSKRNLTIGFLCSLLIAVLMTVASILGLIHPQTTYPTEALRQAFFANDVVNLIIGLPTLLGALWLTWRGRLVGLLFWPGALMFVLYNSLAYVFSIPTSWSYLLYLILVVLSTYTMIGLMASIDVAAAGRLLSGAVPDRFSGAILILLGTFNFLRVFVVMATAIADPLSVPATDLSVLPSDLMLSPAWIIGGILLWQRKALGYASGLALLYQGCMLFIGLIAFLLLQPLLTEAPFVLSDIIVVLIMGLICFIPFALFARGIQRMTSSS
jgi:hypothetical protein